ncbi:MAG: HTTM domain-containing protein [Planctomycetes bacterium]|nr:HTTM domain-containing protein [Planctomycetota bacterium]
MVALMQPIRRWLADCVQAWDRFWFTPALPHTLALIRILAGAMLFYTHLVWTFDLEAFLGGSSWVSPHVARELSSGYAWSYLWHIESPAVLWGVHVGALVVFALLTLGLFSRVTAVLAWLITVSYCHRLSGALFGLDQVNAMLSMYLALGPCGAAYSLDRWLARGRAGEGEPVPSTHANVAVRLMQLHLCIVYLFSGIGKMRGELWWDGGAVWYAVANLEYQSWDLSWLAHHPGLIALATHVTVLWETFYCALVWPRLTRPIALLVAVGVHGGIALALGMVTFGIAMIIANLAFLSSESVRDAIGWGRGQVFRDSRLPIA